MRKVSDISDSFRGVELEDVPFPKPDEFQKLNDIVHYLIWTRSSAYHGYYLTTLEGAIGPFKSADDANKYISSLKKGTPKMQDLRYSIHDYRRVPPTPYSRPAPMRTAKPQTWDYRKMKKLIQTWKRKKKE